MRLYSYAIAGYDSLIDGLQCGAGYVWAKSDDEAKEVAAKRARESFPKLLATCCVFPTEIAISSSDTLVHLKS